MSWAREHKTTALRFPSKGSTEDQSPCSPCNSAERSPRRRIESEKDNRGNDEERGQCAQEDPRKRCGMLRDDAPAPDRNGGVGRADGEVRRRREGSQRLLCSACIESDKFDLALANGVQVVQPAA